MKSIVCVNYEIPTVDHEIDYMSYESLRDYDIAIFDPKFPKMNWIEFSGGGSCLEIEATEALNKALAHWSTELRGALQSGKTVFILLNEFEKINAATGSFMKSRNQRTYTTVEINNYRAIPFNIPMKNATGRKIIVKDRRFSNLHEIIGNTMQYRVILINNNDMKITFSAKDGSAIGSIIRLEGLPGSLVLLPYFSFNTEEFTKEKNGNIVWNDRAIRASRALIGQVLSIDKTIKGTAELTPPPNWIDNAKLPAVGATIDVAIADIDARIKDLEKERSDREQAKSDLNAYTHLLYETGKPLERVITKTLQLLGYEVDMLRIGDLEIDHVIVDPNGKRMIGEAEGKDTSAIDIGKFRQLVSNVQEDFAREEVNALAKGLLFGNGYRLTPPENRPEQFTQKSLTNALLYGTALIRTADLYHVVLHLLDHPEDDDYRTACRAAIEDTAGGIVTFPTPT